MEIEQMLAKADKIADYYVKLQQKIFYLLIDSFKTTRPELINQDDPDSILEWRLRALSKIGALTKDTIKIVSNTSGKSESYIYDLIKDDGLEVAKDINAELSDALKQNKPISPEVNSIISSYAAQTFRDINNNVNQSLLSTNYSKNGAVRAYQDIINQTVLEVQTGLKTPDRALKDNIYKWRDNGIKTNLVDKAGHNWSLEGYTRTVIRTTAARTYNDLRIQSMKDFDSVLATMSSHPASRPACAPIQGKIVNIVPRESPRCDPEYPSIYDYGYGKPSGCFGINCGHKLYPYIKGVSHNFQKQYDPKEAVEKQKIQQKQRYYERNIRRLKYDLDLARRQNDVSSERKFNQAIRGYQSKLREIVKNNDFLTRQYDREQIGNPRIRSHEVLKKELAALHKEYGPHGFPKDVQEYKKLLYNKDTGGIVNAYVKARRQGMVEPVVTYQDFINIDREFDKKISGSYTQNGLLIKGLSDHAIPRIFGARFDHSHRDSKGNPLRRIGTDIDTINKVLKNGNQIEDSDKAEGYAYDGWKVFVSKITGLVITIEPSKRKKIKNESKVG